MKKTKQKNQKCNYSKLVNHPILGPNNTKFSKKKKKKTTSKIMWTMTLNF